MVFLEMKKPGLLQIRVCIEADFDAVLTVFTRYANLIRGTNWI